MAKSPFPWFGGKATPRIKNFILDKLPKHRFYIEPFGGGGSILLAKEPAEVEVYNDVNRGVVNFFRVIADVDSFSKFIARTSLLPVSRELYEEYARTWSGVHDPVEQAIRWYLVIQQSFSSAIDNSWRTNVTSSRHGMAQTAAAWLSSFDRLPEVHARLQHIQIECCDWRDCLQRYRGAGWLAYCDPPYVLGARRAGGYQHELQDKDHQELIQALLAYDGAVLLSGYNSPLYEPLMAAGWGKDELDVPCYAAGHTQRAGLVGAGSTMATQRRVECLWRNPAAVGK